MASTGDDGSETESVPGEVFHRSSSAVGGAEEAGVQYAQNPYDDDMQPVRSDRDSLTDDSHDEPDREDFEGQDSSDEDYQRENRFDGPASTWRFYTAAERGLVASLDQERANDLSVHLYNAHALKRCARDSTAMSASLHHNSKKRWIQDADAEDVPWHPDESWTAWPLKPGDVPRQAERYAVPVPTREEDRATFQRPVSWKPSSDLEDEIQSRMMSTAKDRITSQAKEALLRLQSLPYREAGRSSPLKRKRSSSGHAGNKLAASAETTLPHSQRRHSHGALSHGDENLEVLLDDDEASEILQPHVRYVISKLDELLLGLHRSRRGHRRESASPRSRSRNAKRKARSRAQSQSGAETRHAETPAAEQSHAHNAGNGSQALAQTTNERSTSTVAKGRFSASRELKAKRKQVLYPRDWSEVIGMASQVGWDPEVVRRANERCSSLFGESMTFSEMDTTSARNTREVAANAATFTVQDESENADGLVCPIDSCSRHTESWPLNKTWRWREHLKRSHKYSKAEISGLEEKLMAKAKEKAAAQDQDHARDGDIEGEDGTARERVDAQ